jgi:amino acid transporter
MAPCTAFIYGVWGAAFYPGVDNGTAVLICIPIIVVIGLFYALYSSSMPRTGGDYVWASRVLHPAIGFATVFFVMFILIAWTGTPGPYVITYSLGPLLNYYGYTNLATFLLSPIGLFLFGTAMILTWAVTVATGTRSMVKGLWIGVGMQFLSTIVYVVVLLSLGHAGFVANFNAMSGWNYDQALAAINAAGYPTGFTTSGTLLGIVDQLLSFTGFNLAVYIAGEVKTVKKTSVISIVGGSVLFALWLYVVYEVTYGVMGAQFVNGMAYLSINGGSAFKLSSAVFSPAFFNLLFIFAAGGNQPLIWIVNIGYMFLIFANLTYVFTAVRMIFSFSFDRILPKAFSKLDRRYNAPYVALIAVWISCMLSLALWEFTPFMSYFAYVVPGWFTMIGIVALSGLVFPFRRKDIFEKSPPIVTKKVAGLPVISWLGGASFALCVWIVYAGFQPAISGALNPGYVVLTFAVFILGLVIYGIAAAYRSRSGIPLAMTFREVPPE